MAEARARREVTLVRAAGGLVVRDGEVLLVHRPRYDDWTFPKGKLDEGETDEECALREVREETGLSCEIVSEAGTTRYADSRGRPKIVRWYLMQPVGGVFEPTDEVDEIRWLEPSAAAQLLSYERDLALVESLP
jgi:8-oxo-dGTP diphosphatase